jgi:hypothetical protein
VHTLKDDEIMRLFVEMSKTLFGKTKNRKTKISILDTYTLTRHQSFHRVAIRSEYDCAIKIASLIWHHWVQ